MENQKQLKNKWNEILMLLSNKFNDGQDLDLEGVIYLIGLQELGQIQSKFKKDQKIDLMHIAICKLGVP
jgi:hypothetical protein